MPSKPFIDVATGELKTDQIIAEAVPLGKLVGLFVAVSFVPLVFAHLVFVNTELGLLFALIGQFVLAVGAGITLMYVIVRGMDLSDQ